MTLQTCAFAASTILMFAASYLGQLASQISDKPTNKQEKKSSTIDWGPEKNGVRCAVSLSSKQEKVSAGEPVRVLFLTKNVGTKAISIITQGHPMYVFTIRMVDPEGKPTPLTSYGRQQMRNLILGSNATSELASGQENKEEFFLSRIYDMTREGVYKVSFSRLIFGEGAPVEVPSNVLTVTVVGQKKENVPK